MTPNLPTAIPALGVAVLSFAGASQKQLYVAKQAIPSIKPNPRYNGYYGAFYALIPIIKGIPLPVGGR